MGRLLGVGGIHFLALLTWPPAPPHHERSGLWGPEETLRSWDSGLAVKAACAEPIRERPWGQPALSLTVRGAADLPMLSCILVSFTSLFTFPLYKGNIRNTETQGLACFQSQVTQICCFWVSFWLGCLFVWGGVVFCFVFVFTHVTVCTWVEMMMAKSDHTRDTVSHNHKKVNKLFSLTKQHFVFFFYFF